MNKVNSLYKFQDDGVSFTASRVFDYRQIYAPLCATDSSGIKSAITPYLSGDIKIDRHRYVTKPASREDLRFPARNFFIFTPKGIISLADDHAKGQVEVGQLWHKVTRTFSSLGLELQSLNFVPISGENVEIMAVTVKNISKKAVKVIPTSSIPIFARALANKHDHEHVTALLNRTQQIKEGVVVEPTMLFDEEGHKESKNVYFVLGSDEKGGAPVGTFPTSDSFLGDGGTLNSPAAVIKNLKPVPISDEEGNGKEAVGALRFKEETLKPKQSRTYILMIGTAQKAEQIPGIYKKFNSAAKVLESCEASKKYWAQKINTIQFNTGDSDHNSWMKWVVLQPVLRRIFGCSFLPDHDYGKGGKGWRDIWQDLLSLILIEPSEVRSNLINNFGGVRIDGSNATIIGSKPGEFLADRNAITRVWMDHGVWPFLTILLYVHQTGDFNILLEENTYFRDPQQSRTFEKDWGWTPAYGNFLKDKKGNIYRGSILEHILIQNLVQFFNVGEHNISRLENADWNDGLDMAFKRGESAAFMSIYGGNLLSLADLLEEISKKKNIQKLSLAKEISILLDSISDERCDYNNIEEKKKRLFEKYFKAVQPEVSGEKADVSIKFIVQDLRKKGQWIFEHIRKQEKITLKKGKDEFQWFNGYYDNNAERVEGEKKGRVWMTLTGQVFPIMSGLAKKEEIAGVIKSVNTFLRDKKLGGYRLNTDFGLKSYLAFGRAFGFAYGTKENGAFFSHMNVMYAYSLYKQGFAREGYEVLNSIYQMAADTEKSKIYPGIPEYFDSEGRGMYHYLTGSASWLVLTKLTQAFGVRGEYGDLVIDPKLVKEEFDKTGSAAVGCHFAGKELAIEFINKKKLDAGQYKVEKVLSQGQQIAFERLSLGGIRVRSEILLKNKEVRLQVVLN